MINLTVKTLDSRNHQFSVDGDMTVEEFKRHIAETVDIPAETQRIIYCGRVLQDTSKLNEHDLDGKVVHLVQRAPPNANSQGARSNRTSSPHPQRRAFRGFDHANTMFLGSVAFPTNFMDSAPPPNPVHTNSRLHVIRRMLRRAERVVSQLENPNRSGEQSPIIEDPQEEVTPVIEARVIVPNSTEPIDEAAILSAVHNYTVSNSQTRRSATPAGNSNANSTNPSTTNNSTSNSGDQQQRWWSMSDPAIPEDPIRTARMAEVLMTLTQIQQRFAPFLERYHNFMRDDPVTSREEEQNMQTEMNRVSEVMHFLAHAYHALSDMFVRVTTPPPRPVLCRPILIQHSAVLQAGIPIQVEAQINLSNERPSAASTPQTPSSTGDIPTTTPNTTAPTATPQSFPSQAVPLISTVRVPIPLDLRSMMTAQGVGTATNATTPIMIGNMMNAQPATNQTASSHPAEPPNNETNDDGSPRAARGDSMPAASTSNPEVEFIMEVTPEGITIDSLETAIIDSNQADDLLRGALNGQQPPNLIQSIMQMAGQLITQRGGQPGTTIGAQFSSSATSAPTLTPTAPSQNSQARGNNQTNPTSSTHTRSTARPHVHLQHHTMHGGFDPFLPCNSHHVTRRRNHQGATAAQQPASGAPRTDQQQQTAPSQDAANQINSLMNSIMTGIRTSYQMRRPGAPATNERRSRATPQGTTSSSTNSDTVPAPTASVPTASNNDQSFNLTGDLFSNGPSLADILQQFPFGAPYVPGESTLTDFIMMLSRNLTMGDVLSLNAGSVAPLARLAGDIQNFFRSTLLNGSTSAEAINSAVEKLLNDIQPFLDTLTQIPIREDVDIDASVRHFLRAKLPLVLQLSSRLADEPANLQQLVDHLISTVKEFCALLHACCEGAQEFEQIFEIIVTRYLQGIPSDLQEWTLVTSRSHLRQFFANLNVPHGIIEPHIVRKNPISAGEPMSQENVHTEHESMETEESVSVPNDEIAPSQSQGFNDISEPLPNVVIGSEPWHNQVPADWVPIIARDAQRQKKQHSQPPFSDAYLAGMPSKRRKIVHGTRSRQGPPMQQIIAESVRRAVTATGLSSVAPLDVVAQAAGSSADIQAAYRGLLRTSVLPSLRNNEDFTPERFPHATTYFSEP